MPFFILRLLLGIGTLAGLVVGTNKLTEISERKYFNKGKCNKCGGHFKVIEGTTRTTTRGYKCDVCDNCVWISHGSDVGYKYIPSAQAKKDNKDKPICPTCGNDKITDREIHPPIHLCIECGTEFESERT